MCNGLEWDICVANWLTGKSTHCLNN
uniref:Uncharacterized protein n=1 Tax=Anguilla anguilla TaxID=7936 RepID=A0A0E9U2D8_ANGAN